jgi:hypothetical protein
MIRVAYVAVVTLVVAVVAGCGQRSAAVVSPATPTCTGACASLDTQKYLITNNAYRDYLPVTPAGSRLAGPSTARVSSVLLSVRGHPPVTETSVRDALSAAFPGRSVDASANAARILKGIGYAVTFTDASTVACIHGWVATDGQAVELSGPTKGEGCLPLLGH